MFADNHGNSQEEIFNQVTQFGHDVTGVNPPDYDTLLLSKTRIDTESSGRQWAY